MDMPVIDKVFGMFPPRYATYLISIFGISSGGVGLAGIILYGVAENLILAHFGSINAVDGGVKKLVLLTIGLSSILLLAGNVILFVGVTSKSGGAVSVAVVIVLILCSMLITVAMALPVSCFFIPSTCLVKRVSVITTVLASITITIFLNIWLYFAVVMWNHQQELL